MVRLRYVNAYAVSPLYANAEAGTFGSSSPRASIVLRRRVWRLLASVPVRTYVEAEQERERLHRVLTEDNPEWDVLGDTAVLVIDICHEVGQDHSTAP